MTREELYSGMFLGTALELRLFLASILLGALLGALYDLFRALRLCLKHPKAAVFAEDVLFVTVSALSIYVFCTELCRGRLRFFVMLGAAAGFGIYLSTFGRLVVRFNSSVVKTAKKALLVIGKVLKKFLGDLCGVPFFRKRGDEIEENPCAKGNK